MTDNTTRARRQKRVALPAVIAGGVSALLLAFSMTPTFSALTAAITNTADTAGMGSLGMQESNSDGSVTCQTTGSATAVNCGTINKYGGSLVMKAGDVATTTVKIKNIGTTPATSFTVKGGTCTQSVATGATVSGAATDLCAKYTIAIKVGATSVWSGTASAFAAAAAADILVPAGATSIAANAETTLTITATLDSGAGATYQGLMISQPITFTYGA